jgi:Zn-dependent protease with chaperone function
MKAISIVFILCILAGCITPQAVPLNDALLSAEDEKRLWEQVQGEQETIDNSGLLYQDPRLESYLNRIVKKLQAHSIDPDFDIRVKVLKDPHLNAFAYPNGVIYVHTGILARVDNEDQLAALLSHEMTHCTHRHSLQVIRSVKERPAGITAVQNTLAKISAVHEVVRLLGSAGLTAALHGYSRSLETEADLVGLDLMAKADYDSYEALKLFKHLKQDIEAEGIEESFFFSSHPKVQQRIENARNWLAENYTGRQTGRTRTADFQSALQGAVLTNARLDLRRGRFDLAQKTIAKYLKAKPDDARAYYLLGETLRQRDDQDDSRFAVSYFEKAILLDPNYPEPHKAMGLIHYKIGEKQLARKYFESCLLLSPNASDQAYIQDYLKNCQPAREES